MKTSLAILACLSAACACQRTDATASDTPRDDSRAAENVMVEEETIQEEDDHSSRGDEKKPAKELSDAQKQMEATIELMREQGVPEAQIEEFRRLSQGFADNAETDEDKQARRNARKAERDRNSSESRYRDKRDVEVRLGDKTFILKLTSCENDPDNYRINAGNDDSKTGAIFRYRRSEFEGQYTSEMTFSYDDSDVSLSPAPFNREGDVFLFDGEVTLRTLFGPTSNRQQRTEVKRMTVKAPC